ncbi:MAG: NAD(P)/FAD-dependent oxidoreductase [Oscillospiraceae bacterium]|nr:NAD(P)/FAD-dependent oxidoreductase [Oscillospiraceae bacterium]
MRYDVAIIGTGPAAISAALTLKLHNKTILWFGSKKLSPKVELSERIANYPGVAMVTGPELNRLYREQIEQAGLEITERQVTNIASTRRGFMLQGGDEIYDAKTVLLCTGAVSPKGFPGEAELLGHGVSYCATCDGFLYPGKTIAVYCGAKEFEHEAEYLAEIAAKVYLFTPYADCGVRRENVILNPGKLQAILGDSAAEGVELRDGTRLDVDGVFVIRPAVAPGRLLRGLEIDGPNIVVNRRMETNKPGCYAAGDCTGRPYQLTKAVGEGNVAAHSIVEYLAAAEAK